MENKQYEDLEQQMHFCFCQTNFGPCALCCGTEMISHRNCRKYISLDTKKKTIENHVKGNRNIFTCNLEMYTGIPVFEENIEHMSKWPGVMVSV